MLVPVTMSTGTRSSSSTWSTPRCAAPRAPPPESTRPIFGRADGFARFDAFCAGAEAGSARTTAAATSRASAAPPLPRVFMRYQLDRRHTNCASDFLHRGSVERRVDEADHHADDVVTVVAVGDLALAVQTF